MKLLEQREIEKAREMKDKIMQEKMNRDRQLHEEKVRRRREQKE